VTRLPALVLAAGLLAACGGAPPEPGVQVGGERIAVVDMHLHTGTWEGMTPRFQERVSERVPRGLKWIMPWVSRYMLGGEGILRELDRAGISAGGVFALYSPHSTGIAPNEMVAEEIALDPRRLFGFASLRVDQWNVNGAQQLAKLESDLQRLDNFIGVKLAHAHAQFRLDDERFYPVYEIAGRLGKPVYLHTGTSPNPGTRLEPPYADPAYLEEAIRRYPATVFILGHSGYDSERKALTFTDSALRLARAYSNVYLEPGALGAKRAEGVLADFLQRLRAAGVIDKMIYGSDGPQQPGYLREHLDRFVAGMQQQRYTVAEMRAILSGNFSRVFPAADWQCAGGGDEAPCAEGAAEPAASVARP
jgi:predicted TIM-barrel fold metal-dependent hydrolase